MKSLMLFLREMLTDVGIECNVSTSHDYKYVMARVEHEGLSFLTITLPQYAKELEKALERGRILDADFAGFRSHRQITPLFLGGLIREVFDEHSGVLLDRTVLFRESARAIRCMRQISLMFAKINLECSEKRTSKAIASYVQCDADIKEWDKRTDDSLREDFRRTATLLFGQVFSNLDRKVFIGDILPKHGPGTTAERLQGNKKYNQLEWSERMEAIFPFGRYATSSWTHFLGVSESIDIREPGTERPVRVITVPKTLKTPRIIAIEPTYVQYMQQGLLEAITEEVRRDHFLRATISWDDQTPNQRMARLGSNYGGQATLDLSEASDRVSNQHVTDLLANHGLFRGAVDACRSMKADVPGHGIISLNKFASMGSALCFPFESMVFLTIILMGIAAAHKTPITKKWIYSQLGKVRIYGDDIIVPVDSVVSVIDHLEAFGLVVNRHKSFWNGQFRESCGMEYYMGVNVNIVRVRQVFPTSRKHTTEIISAVSLRNQLFYAGYENAVRFLDNLIEGLIPFPVVEETSAILGKASYEPVKVSNWDDALQSPLVKGMVVHAKPRQSKLEGYGALVKFFLKRGTVGPVNDWYNHIPVVDRDHLLYAGRPVSVTLKHRMARPY